MKSTYLLLGMAAIASAFTACSNDDGGGVGPVGRNAIAFNATAPFAPSGRAAVTTNTLTNFTVYGFVNGEVYMNGVQVNKVGSNWEYSPVQYWPVEHDVNFFSYAPSNIKDMVTSITPAVTETSGKPDITGYRCDGKTDFLYGVNMGMRSTDGQVKVNLRHALAQVHIQLRVDQSGMPLEANIYDVAITNIVNTGDFTFPRQTTTPSSTDVDKMGIWVSNQQGTDTNVLFNASSANMAEDVDEEYEYVYDRDMTMFIPQILANGTGQTPADKTCLRVRMQLRDDNTKALVWPNANSYEYDAATKTACVYIPLSTATCDEWQMGKLYRYNITLKAPTDISPIIFGDVTVDEFQQFSNIDL